MAGFIQIVVFIGVGVLLRAMPAANRVSHTLNRLALYIALPALVLLKVPHLPLDRSTFVIALFPWLLLLFSAAVILLCAYRWGWSKPVTGALLMAVPLGNTGFLGVPIVNALFGEEGLAYVIVYDQLGTLLILVSYCSFVVARFGEGSNEVSLLGMARKVFLFPPMIAFLVGLLLRDVSLPSFFTVSLSLIAAALTPMVMLAIGMQLKLRLQREILKPFTFGLTLKLILAPLLTYGICNAFGFHGLAYDVTVLEAGMPPMITASAMAVNARMDADLSVALAGLGLLCALGTLPLLFFVLT